MDPHWTLQVPKFCIGYNYPFAYLIFLIDQLVVFLNIVAGTEDLNTLKEETQTDVLTRSVQELLPNMSKRYLHSPFFFLTTKYFSN